MALVTKISIKDLAGDYEIIGTNQDNSGNNYLGKLFLSVTEHNNIAAKWLINNEQEQFGNGYLEKNLLKIHFYYYGKNNAIFKGKVVYEILTKDIFEGRWSEEFGNKNFIGTENCFRVKHAKETLN